MAEDTNVSSPNPLIMFSNLLSSTSVFAIFSPFKICYSDKEKIASSKK